MNALALAFGLAALGAGGASDMLGKPAPDLLVAEWPTGPAVHLRNLRGRKVVLLLYHTAC